MKDKKTGTFKTLEGEKFKITGFTRMMAIRVEEAVKTAWELEEKRPLPKRPTYTVPSDDAFGSEEIVYYHTEDTLETDEEKKAWEEYQNLQDELNTRVWKQMMYQAMNCVVVPMDVLKQYVRKYRQDTGLSLPNPEEHESRVKRIFVEHVVLCDSTDEMMRLLTETMQVAGVINDEEASAAIKSFRDSQTEQDSEPPKRQDASEPTGDS
jgi:cell fate (sporulation/competence/biofilm development) regulator YlbF (YheA/YmcA/DUF963 family)